MAYEPFFHSWIKNPMKYILSGGFDSKPRPVEKKFDQMQT